MIDISKYSFIKQNIKVKKFIKTSSITSIHDIYLSSLNKNERNLAIGNLSKSIFKDDKFYGTVLLYDGKTVEIENGELVVDSGISLATLDELLGKSGILNFNKIRTIPGRVGGALMSNATFLGESIYSNLISVYGIDYRGKFVTIDADDIELSYRHSSLSQLLFIVLKARYKLEYGSQEEVNIRRNEGFEYRNNQPKNILTLGSTFKNGKTYRAYSLLKRLPKCNYDSFEISDVHSNFLSFKPHLKGSKLTSDLYKLQNDISTHYGIKPEFEIRFIS